MATDEYQQKEHLKIVDHFYTALHDLTGHEYEIRKDQQSVYIYHASKEVTKRLTRDCILYALYGIMLSADVRTLHIEGFGVIGLTTLKNHIRAGVDLAG